MHDLLHKLDYLSAVYAIIIIISATYLMIHGVDQ